MTWGRARDERTRLGLAYAELMLARGTVMNHPVAYPPAGGPFKGAERHETRADPARCNTTTTTAPFAHTLTLYLSAHKG